MAQPNLARAKPRPAKRGQPTRPHAPRAARERAARLAQIGQPVRSVPFVRSEPRVLHEPRNQRSPSSPSRWTRLRGSRTVIGGMLRRPTSYQPRSRSRFNQPSLPARSGRKAPPRNALPVPANRVSANPARASQPALSPLGNRRPARAAPANPRPENRSSGGPVAGEPSSGQSARPAAASRNAGRADLRRTSNYACRRRELLASWSVRLWASLAGSRSACFMFGRMKTL